MSTTEFAGPGGTAVGLKYGAVSICVAVLGGLVPKVPPPIRPISRMPCVMLSVVALIVVWKSTMVLSALRGFWLLSTKLTLDRGLRRNSAIRAVCTGVGSGCVSGAHCAEPAPRARPHTPYKGSCPCWYGGFGSLGNTLAHNLAKSHLEVLTMML